jgi:hypothetical protein
MAHALVYRLVGIHDTPGWSLFGRYIARQEWKTKGREERRMNPKCLGRAIPDTFSARSADLTGLKMRRITRAVLIDRMHSVPALGAELQDIELAIVSQRVSGLLHNLPAIGPSSPRSLLGAEYR